MFELKTKEFNGTRVVDSRDVAMMVERNHNELMKSIRLYAGYLTEGDFAHGEFFLESSYVDVKGGNRPCYLITKKGCDMIANKTTGKKGVLFTAAYVTAFNEMQEQITKRPCIPPTVSPGGLANLIRITRLTMIDMGCTPVDIGQMVQGVYQTWNVSLPDSFTRQCHGQTCLQGFCQSALEDRLGGGGLAV